MTNVFTILFDIALKALSLLKQYMARVSIMLRYELFVMETLADSGDNIDILLKNILAINRALVKGLYIVCYKINNWCLIK